jgi:hypothetical protein
MITIKNARVISVDGVLSLTRVITRRASRGVTGCDRIPKGHSPTGIISSLSVMVQRWEESVSMCMRVFVWKGGRGEGEGGGGRR